MIASTLGIIVMLGILNIFEASQRTNLLARAVNDIQEDARIGMELLVRSARKGGYYPRIVSTPKNQTINMPLTFVDAVTAIPPIATTSGWTSQGALGASDSVAFLSFYDSTGREDCTGANPTSGTYWVDRFYVQTASGVSSLYCQSHRVSVASVATITAQGSSGTATALIDGVTNFQVEYGVDNDDDRSVDYWTNFTNVANPVSVVAVRLWLSISDDIQGLDPLTDKTFTTTRFFQSR